MDKYEQAHKLAKLTWISGPTSVAKTRMAQQKEERIKVIRMWNEGASLVDIGYAIKKPVHYVSKYLQRFEFFYGKAAVAGRRIPEKVPEV